MATITDLEDIPGAIIGRDLTVAVTPRGHAEIILLTFTEYVLTPKWKRFDYNPATLPEGYVPVKDGYIIKVKGLGNIQAPAGYEFGLLDGSYITDASVEHDPSGRSLLPSDLFDPKYGYMFFMLDDGITMGSDAATWGGTMETNCYAQPPALPGGGGGGG